MSDVELELARKQIEFARSYTKQLIETVPDELWFTCPSDLPTHLAWQIGHLAMAQYGLTIMRIRGREPEDEQLIPKSFLRKFKKGSSPSAGADDYPTVDEIRSTWNDVHAVSMDAMAKYQAADLEESLPDPTAVYANKLGSLLMCSAHEMLHAGQIGLIRRALGLQPIR